MAIDLSLTDRTDLKVMGITTFIGAFRAPGYRYRGRLNKSSTNIFYVS